MANPERSSGDIFRELKRRSPSRYQPLQIRTLQRGMQKIRAYLLEAREEQWQEEVIRALSLSLVTAEGPPAYPGRCSLSKPSGEIVVRQCSSHPPLSAKQKSLDSWYHTCMSAYQTDFRIDDYIATLPGWQQEMCRQVRELVHVADPEVTETIKRTRQPYFTLHGNICALLGAKDHLTIFIYDPIVPDPEGLINQGQGNRTARAIQVRQGETINECALLNLFRAIIANNRAGGWRKLKGSQ